MITELAKRQPLRLATAMMMMMMMSDATPPQQPAPKARVSSLDSSSSEIPPFQHIRKNATYSERACKNQPFIALFKTSDFMSLSTIANQRRIEIVLLTYLLNLA